MECTGARSRGVDHSETRGNLRAEALLVGGITLLSCSTPRSRVREASPWAVDPTPALTVGTKEADPGHELAGVFSARLVGATLIVANSGSSELRRFDSLGRYQGAEGRKGQGPGEFLGTISLFPAPGDSLYSFDDQNLRWSIHDLSGHYGRVLSGGQTALPRPTWLYRRAIVASNTLDTTPEWALVVLDSLRDPPREAPLRNARFDDLGYLWVTDSLPSNRWTVYAGPGDPVGRVTLPPGFVLVQAGEKFVLGIESGGMDEDIVRAYSLHRPDRMPRPAAMAAAELSIRDSAQEARMIADLRDVTTAQEVFYSQHASYTSSADSLTAKLNSGSELVLLAGDKRHWAAVLYHRASRTTCGIAVGAPAPVGWLDGLPFCGR